jgi:GTPase SAR1 family protein
MQWKDEIDKKVLLPNEKPLPVVLLGNKCDLDEAEIDKSQLDKFCNEKGFAGWFDTSAKLNINIEKAARFLVERILEHQDIFQKKKVTQVSSTKLKKLHLAAFLKYLWDLSVSIGCISARCGQ